MRLFSESGRDDREWMVVQEFLTSLGVPFKRSDLKNLGQYADVDVDFREGLGTFITPTEAIAWMRTPGLHWLKAECYDSLSCVSKLRSARAVAAFGGSRAIYSVGPDRGWPPVGR